MNGHDLAKLLDDYLARLERENVQYVYGVDEGRDYLKIWRRPRSSDVRSAVMFVGRDGTLYRAESWKKRGRALSHLREVGRDRSRRRDVPKRTTRARFVVVNRYGDLETPKLSSERVAREYAQRWSKEAQSVYQVVANWRTPERRVVAVYQNGAER